MTPPHTRDVAWLEELRTAVLTHVGAFLAGRESAQDLDAWLLDTTWNVRLNFDPTTRALVGRVGRYLTEYAKGHRTDDELWHVLLGILAETPARPRVVKSASSQPPLRVSAKEALAPQPAAVRKLLQAGRA